MQAIEAHSDWQARMLFILQQDERLRPASRRGATRKTGWLRLAFVFVALPVVAVVFARAVLRAVLVRCGGRRSTSCAQVGVSPA